MSETKQSGPIAGWFKRHWQIIYAVFLIVLVPVLIVLNTLYSVSTYRNNIDITLQREALVIGQMFNIAAADKGFGDAVALQKLVNDSAKQVPEVYALDVLVPSGAVVASDSFRINASLDPGAVGGTSTQVQNVLAWSQNESFAFLTAAPARSSDDATAKLAPDPNKRYWGIIMPLRDASGKKQALLFMKISLETIDALVRATLFRSYIYLALTVLLTVLVLASNTRLFQYASLFRKLKEVDEMKDQFIGMASHELRTPITAIKGFVSLFLDNAFGPFQGVARDKMGIVFMMTERLGDLVEDLLDVSRIEQGRMEMTLAPTQLEEVIAGVMEELGETAKTKGLALRFEKPSLPLPKVNVDPSRMRQVFVNIFGNAIKYTPKGSVTITAYVEEGHVKIKCTDTGLGMSAEARERLFEKFYRIKTEATSKIVGTGLGLWITKQIVEMQHGKIYVDSIEGVGTQMTVALPPIKAEEKKVS